MRHCHVGSRVDVQTLTRECSHFGKVQNVDIKEGNRAFVTFHSEVCAFYVLFFCVRMHLPVFMTCLLISRLCWCRICSPPSLFSAVVVSRDFGGGQ